MSNSNKKTEKKPSGLIRLAKVIKAGNESEIKSLERSQDRAYWLYNFTLGFIPYKKQKEITLTRTLFIGGKTQQITLYGHHQFGLPYGKVPRLLILYFITQAKLGNKQIDVSHVSKFLRELGLTVEGRTIKRVKEELIKLNSLRYQFEERSEESYSSKILDLTDNALFYISWLGNNNNPKTIDNKTLPFVLPDKPKDAPEGDYIRLDDAFYEHVQTHAFPVDKEIIKVLSQSSLAFEIYMFLTYNHNKNFKMNWAELMQRFGMGYKNDKHGRFNFKKKFREQFYLVKAAYKGNNSELSNDGLLILHSVPSVRGKKSKQAVEFSSDSFKQTSDN